MGKKEQTAHEMWEGMLAQESKNGTKSEAKGLPHDELQERWSGMYPGMAWSGGDWYKYDQGYWTRIPSDVVEQQIYDVLKGCHDDGVKPTGNLLGSVLRLARAATVTDPDVWDSNPDVLVLKNGTLDIPTRTLREHRPEDYATTALPYDYEPDAVAWTFEEVICNAIPRAVGLLQEFAGYALTIDTDHELALWFKGPRGSGKSTIIEGITAMLGEKHGVLGLAEISNSAFALDRIPGKTLLVSTEQPSSYLKSTHIVDALISGERLRIERKYKGAQEIRPVAKVLWAMNDLPRISNTTAGLFRRVKIVNFPPLASAPDPEVKKRIRKEGPGILNWALDGLARLRARGEFQFPAAVLEATAAWEASNDVEAAFIDQECIVGSDEKISPKFLREKYVDWCKLYGYGAKSQARFNEELVRLGFEQKRTNKERHWIGLGPRLGEQG